jgi:hypothetical protein
MRALPLLNSAALCLALTAALPVRAQPPLDLSGTYPTREDVSGLYILGGEGRLVLRFDAVFGPTAHTCDCLLEARAQGAGRYVFTTELGGVRVEDGKLVVELSQPSCCGAGFGGFSPVPLTKRSRPEQCTVKGERAKFYGLDGQPVRAYVVKGDKVDAVPAGPFMDGFMVARFQGKRRTLGLLKREDLSCPHDAARSTATASAPPEATPKK